MLLHLRRQPIFSSRGKVSVSGKMTVSKGMSEKGSGAKSLFSVFQVTETSCFSSAHKVIGWFVVEELA